MWNFQGSLFLALEFPNDLTQFCGISRGWAVLSGISRGKVKKVRNSRGVFKKVYLQPPCLDSFWNSPFQGICKSNNHFFQGLLVFKNLLAHTPVWIKNGIAQWIRPTRLTNHVYLLLLEVTAKTFCCTQRDDAKEK